MAACPNCGRQTLRTKDWACQWCGYPLISRAFKKIDKTFKELQEERSLNATTVDSDMDAEAESTHIPEAEPGLASEPEPALDLESPAQAPEKKPKFRFFRKPEPTLRPEPGNELERKQEEPPPVSPVSRTEPESRPAPGPAQPEKPVYRPVTPPKQEPVTEPVQKASPPPASVTKPEPEMKPTPARPPTPAPELPAAKPEIVVEQRLAPVSSIKPEDIKDGMEITADDLDALFRSDKSGTNIKLTGKTIVLQGRVEKVFIREHLDIRYIVVTGMKKTVWSARCAFEKENSGKAGRLNEGEAVAVRGKYDGYGKNVIFKDCEIV